MSALDQFDLVVIGAGPAGEKGATQAAYFGKRVCLIERAPPSAADAAALSAQRTSVSGARNGASA